jgi:serine acetyltransferase/GT2 family glycosyltransferase
LVEGSIAGFAVSATVNSEPDKFGLHAATRQMSLWALVREDWITHGRDWTLPGFRAVAVCRFGQWRMGIRSKILRAPCSVFYRMLYRNVRNYYGIELPCTVVLGRRVVIEHQSGIIVHGLCRIGDDCILRQGVTLANRRPSEPHAVPILGNGVNVGAGAKILGQVTVGDGAQIGANAVVLEDVPPGGRAVGVPAKIVLPEPPTAAGDVAHAADEIPISDEEALKSVGIVAIGRNEGERLRRCLSSAANCGCPIVYVDSDSTDGSLACAQSFGAETVELDRSQSFTAARGRNAGSRRLTEMRPDLEFIQFLDGDCELCDGWLAGAARFAQQHPEVGVVCGRRRELDPARNIYHAWTDMEWDTPVGEAKYCGGDALVRAASLERIGGYREGLIAGEEPEMCVRMRDAGWKVWRIDRDMTLHDIDIRSFGQWWKRSVRSGHAYAEGAALHGAPPERHWMKESRSIWFWGAAIPLLAVLFAWSTGGVSILLAGIAYLALFAKIFLSRQAERAEAVATSASFAAMCMAMKWPQAIGQLMYWNRRLRRSPSEIIEYGGKPASNDAVSR